jgi:8-oxo-dGTP pyrophosphatase MutT (NUDIX family)
MKRLHGDSTGYNGRVIDESWYIRPESGVKDRTSAGGIIIREGDDGEVWIALTRGEGALSGYILPKGGVDPGESIEEAARREIEEEAGFSELTLLESLGSRARLSYDKHRWITTHYFVFSTEETDPRPTDPNYDYVTEWFLLHGELPELFWPEQRALIESYRMRQPSGR